MWSKMNMGLLGTHSKTTSMIINIYTSKMYITTYLILSQNFCFFHYPLPLTVTIFPLVMSYQDYLCCLISFVTFYLLMT